MNHTTGHQDPVLHSSENKALQGSAFYVFEGGPLKTKKDRNPSDFIGWSKKKALVIIRF
jgi:hypothetical protein